MLLAVKPQVPWYSVLSFPFGIACFVASWMKMMVEMMLPATGGSKRALNAEEGTRRRHVTESAVLVGVPLYSGDLASPIELAWSPSNRYDESTSMDESIFEPRDI